MSQNPRSTATPNLKAKIRNQPWTHQITWIARHLLKHLPRHSAGPKIHPSPSLPPSYPTAQQAEKKGKKSHLSIFFWLSFAQAAASSPCSNFRSIEKEREMSGGRLCGVLGELGYQGHESLDPDSFEWPFQYEEARPLLDWICSSLRPANVLSPTELSQSVLLISSIHIASSSSSSFFFHQWCRFSHAFSINILIDCFYSTDDSDFPQMNLFSSLQKHL